MNISTDLPALHDGAGDRGADASALVASRYRRASISPLRLALLAAGADLLALTQACWMGAFLSTPAAAFDPLAAALAALGAAVATVALLLFLSAYSPHRLSRAQRSVPVALGAALVPLVAVALVTPPDLAWPLGRRIAVLLAVLVPLRIGMAGLLRWARDSGLLDRRAVIAGGGAAALRLIRELAEPGSGLQLCAIFDDRTDDRSPPQVLGIPKIGKFADLPDFCRRAEIDLIIISLPLSAKDRLAGLLRQFRVLPQPVHLAAVHGELGYSMRGAGRDLLIAALPASFVPRQRLAKRLFDLTFASAALLLLAPVLILAALAVRLDSPGPVLFRQPRHGFNDRTIEIWKFRTLRQEHADPAARRIVTRDDPRVTRVGRFLRRSSIDELPQLFNVLAGSLSLVGPRPHAVHAVSSGSRPFDEIVESYSARHRLPPGITGWAQINGWRGEIRENNDLRQRMEHDLYYIENWSLWFDLVILLRTPLCLLRAARAY